jgi:hypothetical protein
MNYGMREKSRGRTVEKMTVGDLIKELQRFPTDARVVLSSDEEGNGIKELREVTFDKEFTGDLHGFFELEGPAVTTWTVTIWPHG